ncbi:MAG: hypothetical protein GY751_24100 [Bacteroidetes bacterium]|nr:hypothetical protein [Bacteroidota bacterium]
MMKNISNFLVAIISTCVLFITACDPIDVQLPDTNPGTPGEGGEILIFDIFDLIEYSSDRPLGAHDLNDISTREYDFQDDGIVDLRVVSSVSNDLFSGASSSLSLQFAGHLLLEHDPLPFFPGSRNYAMFLPVDGLLGGSFSTGGWADAWQDVDILAHESTTLLGVLLQYAYYPTGISYLPTKTRINGEDYYGWLEVASTDHGDADTDEQLLISRFGISQTPGLRIRMGQE